MGSLTMVYNGCTLDWLPIINYQSLIPQKLPNQSSTPRVIPCEASNRTERPMKAKLKTALKSNVDPLFFALACAALFSVSMSARALTEDVLSAVNDSPGTVMMMTKDGQLVWRVE